MPKDDAVYVGHILDTCRKALDKTAGTTRAGYDLVWDVVTVNLPQLAEALERIVPADDPA